MTPTLKLDTDSPEQARAREERIQAKRVQKGVRAPPSRVGDIGWGDTLYALNITDTGFRRWFQRNQVWIDGHPEKGDRLSFTWRDIARLKITKLLVTFGFRVSDAFQ